MRDSFDVLIVGGAVVGSAAAYYLFLATPPGLAARDSAIY